MFLFGFPFFFIYFVLLVTEKVVLALKFWFWQANGMRSTRSLFEIQNTITLKTLKLCWGEQKAILGPTQQAANSFETKFTKGQIYFIQIYLKLNNLY